MLTNTCVHDCVRMAAVIDINPGSCMRGVATSESKIHEDIKKRVATIS